MKLFKSKAEKELEARMAIKQTINSLKKYDRTLDKKKDEMLSYAQTAKEQGIAQQYQVAVSGLKMILAYQKRCKTMILQIQMTESMKDLTALSSGFVQAMGKVGKQLVKINNAANFARNQMEFEKGMMAAEAAMDQLESFMDDAGMTLENSQSETDLDSEIESMIDATGAAKVSTLDHEIDQMLGELEGRKAKLKE